MGTTESTCSGDGSDSEGLPTKYPPTEGIDESGKLEETSGPPPPPLISCCKGVGVDVSKLVREPCQFPSTHPTENALAYVVRGAFSPDECAAIIADVDKRRFKQALINVGGGRQVLMPEVRNNKRVMVDDVGAAAWIWDRIKGLVPEKYRGFSPVGLNERLRFLRYDGGEYFAPHYDGVYVRNSGPKRGEHSLLTLLLYLNEGYEGGRTTFLRQYDEERERVEIEPTTGACLIVQHDIYHEGSVLVKGRKYVMRTDIMFAPTAMTLRDLRPPRRSGRRVRRPSIGADVGADSAGGDVGAPAEGGAGSDSDSDAGSMDRGGRGSSADELDAELAAMAIDGPIEDTSDVDRTGGGPDDTGSTGGHPDDADGTDGTEGTGPDVLTLA